jgi:NIMA (never in mitosis gene a)-related kinase
MENYKVIKVLGQGSFGKALLVCDKRNKKRKFVVKEVVIGHLSAVDKAKAEAEADVLKQMKHSNIISYVESFLEKSNLYIVMDFADGGDLSDKIKEKKKSGLGRFSEDEVMAIFVQLCLALKHIHQKKVLHRDIKSQNVFMTQTGIVKLGDFGVAKVLENTMAKAQTQIGTPFYLSPEICRGESYEHKSDIWSLGCLLYEMIAMKVPFAGSNLPALIRQITSAAPPNLKGNYSSDLKNLAFDLLNKRPQARPSIKEILTMPFVKNHTKRLLSLLQRQQSQTQPDDESGAPAVAEEKADGDDVSIGHKNGDEKEDKEAKGGEDYMVRPARKASPASRPGVSDLGQRQTQEQQRQEQQRQQQQRGRQRQQGAQRENEKEAAKQMFWENQAAAKRNRQKHKDGNPGNDFFPREQEAKREAGRGNPYSSRAVAVERERAHSREDDDGMDLPGSRYGGGGGGAGGGRGRGEGRGGRGGGRGESAASKVRSQQEIAREQWLENRAVAARNRERVEEDMGRYAAVDNGGDGGDGGDGDGGDEYGDMDRAARVRAKAKKEQDEKRAGQENAMAEAARKQAEENREFVRRMKQRAKEAEEEEGAEEGRGGAGEEGSRQEEEMKQSGKEAKGEEREKQMAEAARQQAAENKEFVRRMRQRMKDEEEALDEGGGAREDGGGEGELDGQQESLQEAAMRRRKQQQGKQKQQQGKQERRRRQEVEERRQEEKEQQEQQEQQRQHRSSRGQLRSQQRSPNAGASRGRRRGQFEDEVATDDEDDDRWREAATADMHVALGHLSSSLKAELDEHDDAEAKTVRLADDAGDIAAMMSQQLAAGDEEEDEYDSGAGGGVVRGSNTGRVGTSITLSFSAPGAVRHGKLKQKSATAAPAEVARASAAARRKELAGAGGGSGRSRGEGAEEEEEEKEGADDDVMDDLPPSRYGASGGGSSTASLAGEYHRPVYCENDRDGAAASSPAVHKSLQHHQSVEEEDMPYEVYKDGGESDLGDDYDDDPDHEATVNAYSNDSISSSIAAEAEDDYEADGFNSDEVDDEEDLGEASDLGEDMLDLELSGLQVTLEEALYFSGDEGDESDDDDDNDDGGAGRHK